MVADAAQEVSQAAALVEARAEQVENFVRPDSINMNDPASVGAVLQNMDVKAEAYHAQANMSIKNLQDEGPDRIKEVIVDRMDDVSTYEC
jgi:hypothetical protein